jgi:tetratricopeptide (TPR) repeat protein
MVISKAQRYAVNLTLAGLIVCMASTAWARTFQDIKVHSLMVQAQSLYDQGDTVQAIEFYRKALGIAPKNPEVILSLASAEEQVGSVTQAQEHWRALIHLDSTCVTAYTHLGFLYLKQQNFVMAVHAFEAAIAQGNELDPQVRRAQEGMEEIARRSVYYRQKMIKAHAHAMQAQLAADQKNQKLEVLNKQVNMYKFTIKESRQLFSEARYQEAVYSLDAVLKFNPSDEEAFKLHQMAVLALTKQKYDQQMDAKIQGVTLQNHP